MTLLTTPPTFLTDISHSYYDTSDDTSYRPGQHLPLILWHFWRHLLHTWPTSPTHIMTLLTTPPTYLTDISHSYYDTSDDTSYIPDRHLPLILWHFWWHLLHTWPTSPTHIMTLLMTPPTDLANISHSYYDTSDDTSYIPDRHLPLILWHFWWHLLQTWPTSPTHIMTLLTTPPTYLTDISHSYYDTSDDTSYIPDRHLTPIWHFWRRLLHTWPTSPTYIMTLLTTPPTYLTDISHPYDTSDDASYIPDRHLPLILWHF